MKHPRKVWVDYHYHGDDGGWWVARAKGIPGCHTQGRTREEAAERLREALSLFMPDDEVGYWQPDPDALEPDKSPLAWKGQAND